MSRVKRSSLPSDEGGTAIQVITPAEDHSFTLDESALEKILYDSRVKNSKVIVISVAGAYRMGKSFLLNFFLRYLYSRGSKNWIGDQYKPLKGFNWRRGTDRDTSGILMWSEPFEVKLPSGEKACVLLMDTQGAFDNQSTVKDCATVFALSTMLSSVQVYNIRCNIQENDLQHLQFFTEYGRLASKASGGTCKSFQDLHVLIRDWQYPDEYDYGWNGGEKYLAKCLEVKVGQHQDLHDPRQHIRSCFTKIGCFPMPYPGKKVTTNGRFDGRLADIDDDFKLHVQEFVSSLLSSDSLVVKEINGKTITGRELFEFFTAYMKIFQGKELPKLQSIFQANEEANSRAAIGEATDYYAQHMKKEVSGGRKLYVDPDTLTQEHERYLQEAVQLFQSKCMLSSEDKIRALEKDLLQQLDTLYKNVYLLNSSLLANAFAEATACYKERMEVEMQISRGNVNHETLDQKHHLCLQEAVELFQSMLEVGDEKKKFDLQDKFEKLVNDWYDTHKALLLKARSHDTLKKILIGVGFGIGVAAAGVGIGVVGVAGGIYGIYAAVAGAGSAAGAAAAVGAVVEAVVVSVVTVATAVFSAATVASAVVRGAAVGHTVAAVGYAAAAVRTAVAAVRNAAATFGTAALASTAADGTAASVGTVAATNTIAAIDTEEKAHVA